MTVRKLVRKLVYTRGNWKSRIEILIREGAERKRRMKRLLLDWAYGVDIDPPLLRIVARSPPALPPPFSLPGPASTTLRPQFGFLQLWAPTGRVVTRPGMPCPRPPPVPPGSRSCSERGAKFSAGYDAPCGRHTRWTRCPILWKAGHPNFFRARDSTE